jgi:hypothetical protein
MNNLPRKSLSQIIGKHGRDICADAARCENLLKDLCGAYRREINVLVNAIEERVPLDLLAANRTTPLELLLTRLEKRLEEQTAMTAEAARWAVESWALALNLATESEIASREKSAKPAPPVSNAAASQTDQSGAGNDAVSPNANRTNRVQTPLPKPMPAPRTRVNPPPVVRQTPPAAKPAPPIFYPKNNPPAAAPPPIQPPQPAQPVIVKKGFGLFRGCLLVFFLLAAASVVLFFGVPYAIEVMRETQRERNNEPPRFPVR